MLKVHRLLYHSTLGLRVRKKKKKLWRLESILNVLKVISKKCMDMYLHETRQRAPAPPSLESSKDLPILVLRARTKRRENLC